MNFCARMVRDRDAAADVVQESYARVLAVRNAGQAIPEPRALLHQTARRLIIDHHRRAAIRQHDDLDSLPEAQHPAAPAHLEPESVYAHEQHALAFAAVIEALPPRCRWCCRYGCAYTAASRKSWRCARLQNKCKKVEIAPQLPASSRVCIGSDSCLPC